MKLYEIAERYRNIEELMDEGIGELDAIQSALDGVEDEFKDKADAIACMIKDYKADADAIKAEEANLSARRKSKEKSVDFLRSYLAQNMDSLGLKKIETDRNVISVRRSKSVVVTDEKEALRLGYGEVKTSIAIDKRAISAAIKKGEDMTGIAFERETVYPVIK